MPLLLLRKSAPSGALLSAAVGIGALGGALGFGGTGRIFGLLVLSAALTAIAQQTLP